MQGNSMVSTPVFLGHGEADEKVPCALGKGAARFIRDAGYYVMWRDYQGPRSLVQES